MATKEQRRLSAILFADIEGYTALMQSDEATANQLLDKFHGTLGESVKAHGGEVINNYGDGCVCTFDSAVSAMKCAKEVQLLFLQDPKVPVRIGVHSGDVLFKDDNVYGDSVNLASRIESLGVPGAILLSGSVEKHIANQNEFEVQSLGAFQFKNVQEPMEVFALGNAGLVVPKREEMKGKTKSSNKKSNWLPIALLILSVIAFGSYFFYQNGNADLLPDEIRNARIAVLPFENQTNDSNLDVVGTMAADWVTEGLMNLKDTKVVSFNNIQSNLKFASFGEGTAPNSDFQKLTGAEKIIKGNYYKINGQLVFKSQIIDAQTGELELTLKDIEGSENDISKIIGALKSRIMGYFVYHDILNIERNPPKYEAYKAYTKALDYFGYDNQKANEQLEKAIQMDSSFTQPYIWLISSYTNRGDYLTADSILSVWQKAKPDLTNTEQGLVDFFRASLDRDIIKKRELLVQVHLLDPKNMTYNFMAGNLESNTNRPLEAISIFEKIDTSILKHKMTTPATTWWNTVYAFNLTRVKRYDEALQILDMIPENFASLESDQFMQRANIDILNNEGKGLNNLIQQMEKLEMSTSFINDVYRSSAITYSLIGDVTQQKEWATNGIALIKSQPEGSDTDHFNLAELYYLSQQYEKAIEVYAQLYAQNQIGSIFSIGKWHHLSRIGTSHARMGNQNKALEVIEQLQNIKDDPTPSGKYTYGISRIYAQLGDKENAMQYMTQAFQEGFIDNDPEFRYGEDVDFIPLKGEEVFENFVFQEK